MPASILVPIYMLHKYNSCCGFFCMLQSRSGETCFPLTLHDITSLIYPALYPAWIQHEAGDILINNQKIDIESIKPIIGFVPQEGEGN